MAKKATETIFGYDVDRRTPTRVVISQGGEELLDLRGSADLSGDALVKAAIDKVMDAPQPTRTDAHVIDVPLGTVAGDAKETR